MTKPIGVSCGDCNGVGLEAFLGAVKFFRQHREFEEVPFRLFVNSDALRQTIEYLNLSYTYQDNVCFDGTTLLFEVEECSTGCEIEWGRETAAAATLALEALEKTAAAAVAGELAAVVTLPVSKNNLSTIGFIYPGQTEFYAARSGSDTSLMVLFTGAVRVALVTVHTPLVKVPKMLTQDLLREKIAIFHKSLQRDFGVLRPRIAVLGLNPHAGENGILGSEEKEIIEPVLEEIRHTIQAEGPFAADGFFAHGIYKDYDGILAMYHDQGLIPIKIFSQGGGVNFTANLPIVRVSPDHGTAYSLAGKGTVRHEATLAALDAAVEISLSRANFTLS